jgi:hypothetical protein
MLGGNAASEMGSYSVGKSALVWLANPCMTASAVKDRGPVRVMPLVMRIESRIVLFRREPAKVGVGGLAGSCGMGGRAARSPKLRGECERNERAVNHT